MSKLLIHQERRIIRSFQESKRRIHQRKLLKIKKGNEKTKKKEKGELI